MYEVRTTSIIKQTLPVLILISLGGTLAGLFLNGIRNRLDVFPGLLVVVPALLGLRGNIAGSMACRLSTALHMGTLRPAILRNSGITPFVVSSLVLTLATSAVIGVLSYVYSDVYGILAPGFLPLVLITMSAALLAGSVHLVINLFISITSFRIGLDPDNVSIPVLTVTGDVITMLCFLLVVRVAI